MSKANKTKPRGKKQAPKPPVKTMNFYWIYGIVGVMLLGMIMLNSSKEGNEIQYSEFKQLVEEKKVDRVTHDGSTYQVYFNELGKEDLDEPRGEGVLPRINAGPDKWFSMPPGDVYREDFKHYKRHMDSTRDSSQLTNGVNK